MFKSIMDVLMFTSALVLIYGGAAFQASGPQLFWPAMIFIITISIRLVAFFDEIVLKAIKEDNKE